jgi:hypothetical protein
LHCDLAHDRFIPLLTIGNVVNFLYPSPYRELPSPWEQALIELSFTSKLPDWLFSCPDLIEMATAKRVRTKTFTLNIAN